MTRQTFYRAFRKAVAKDVAKLGKNNWVASNRGYIRYEDKGRCDCPIVFLYRVRTGISLTSEDYEKAAKAMGLKTQDADTIANGADNYRSGLRKLDMKRAQAARKVLLRAIIS